MILPESLTIQGYPVLGVPLGAALDIERLRASEDVVMLDGRTRRYQADQPGGWVVTLTPPDTSLIPLACKQAVEAALWAGQPVTIRETLSDPTQERVWTGLLIEKPTLAEAPGTGRLYYTYTLKIRQEEP